MTVPPSFPSQPGVDQESGQLDSWPARPIKPASSFPPRNASTAPHPSVHRSRSAKIPDRMPVAPKPKFLEQLEAYLHREMKLLECPPDGPHELRLQASHSLLPPLPSLPVLSDRCIKKCSNTSSKTSKPTSHFCRPSKMSMSYSLLTSSRSSSSWNHIRCAYERDGFMQRGGSIHHLLCVYFAGSAGGCEGRV